MAAVLTAAATGMLAASAALAVLSLGEVRLAVAAGLVVAGAILLPIGLAIASTDAAPDTTAASETAETAASGPSVGPTILPDPLARRRARSA